MVQPDGVKRMIEYFCLVQNQIKALAVLLHVCPCLSGPELQHQCPAYRGQNVRCNDSQDTDFAQEMVDHICLVQKQTQTTVVLLHVCPAD